MKKHVNYLMIIVLLFAAAFALMGRNICIVNAEEITEDSVKNCENGHTPAEEWTLKRPAKFKSNGVKYLECTVCGKMLQRKEIPYIASVKVIHKKLVSNGKPFTPTVKVTDKDGNTIDASNYTVKYYDNVWPGKAVAELTFKGEYGGQIKRGFKICMGKVTMSRVENTPWGIRISWKTPPKGIYGAQIYRSTNGGEYESVFWFPSRGRKWFVDKNATTPGAKYSYKVCVMKLYYGESIYDTTSTTPPKSVVCRDMPLSVPKVANTSKGVKVSWKKVPYASYYVVRGSGYKDGVLKNNILIAKVKAGGDLSIIDKDVLTRTIKKDDSGKVVERATVNYYVTAVISTDVGTFRRSSPRTNVNWYAVRKNKVAALKRR
ncbi:MAG: hypothetical protein PUG00_04500 [Clostridiales bacterium]|nr:hypothetical protein [Clostridiales bacterium]